MKVRVKRGDGRWFGQARVDHADRKHVGRYAGWTYL
jgi:hypothetical protein